jgi:hypothetical protein
LTPVGEPLNTFTEQLSNRSRASTNCQRELKKGLRQIPMDPIGSIKLNERETLRRVLSKRTMRHFSRSPLNTAPQRCVEVTVDTRKWGAMKLAN